MKSRPMTLLVALLISITPLTAWVSPASANSLATTSPAAGAVVETPPNAVSVVGTSALEADGNQLTVVDPKGAPVDDGSLTVADSSVVIGLKPLTLSGVYTVSYTLLAAGEDPLQGTYTFLYNAPATLAPTTPTPSPTISKTSGATGSSHAAAIFVIIIFLMGCAVLIFLLWYARTLWRAMQKKRRKATKKKSAPSARKE